MMLSKLFYSILIAGTGVQALSSTVSSASATGTLLPLPTICTTPDYSRFNLYAKRDNGTTYPVRLLPSSTPNVTTMIVNTNAVRPNAGVHIVANFSRAAQVVEQFHCGD